MFSKTAPSQILALRARIAQLERGGAKAERGIVPIGLPAVDAVLADGGLALGALHEAMGGGPDTEHAAAATLFAATILTRLDGPILWVLRQADLFAPSLANVGLSLNRILFVEAGRDVLAAMEEGLRHHGLAAVVGEVMGRMTLVASRRLRLAAEQSGALAIAIRRSQAFDDPVLLEPSAAVTRWRVTALPSPAGMTSMLEPARWRLDLIRDRDGKSGSWTMEEADATGCLRLVAQTGDGQADSGQADDGRDQGRRLAAASAGRRRA